MSIRLTDEFWTLRGDADEFGIAWRGRPAVARTQVTVTGDRVVSALVWGATPPEIVLLHGGGLNAHTWDAVALSLGRSALAVDLPGHGRSSWRADADYRPATIAADLAIAIEALAPDAGVVVGQSLGGLAALALVDLRPDLVRGLGIVDVSPGLVVGSGNPVRDFLADAESFADPSEIVERARRFGFGHSTEAVERAVFHNTRQRDDGRWVFTHHLASLPPDAPRLGDFASLWAPLERTDVPVQLIRGSRGFLSDADTAVFLAHQPRARTITIDAGHNVQEDAPVELAVVLRTLLDAPTRS